MQAIVLTAMEAVQKTSAAKNIAMQKVLEKTGFDSVLSPKRNSTMQFFKGYAAFKLLTIKFTLALIASTSAVSALPSDAVLMENIRSTCVALSGGMMGPNSGTSKNHEMIGVHKVGEDTWSVIVSYDHGNTTNIWTTGRDGSITLRRLHNDRWLLTCGFANAIRSRWWED